MDVVLREPYEGYCRNWIARNSRCVLKSVFGRVLYRVGWNHPFHHFIRHRLLYDDYCNLPAFGYSHEYG